MSPIADDAGQLAQLLRDFFLERLIRERRVSPCTVASYRDTFRLLLPYAADRLKKKPTQLALPDLDAPVIVAFLGHLETDRLNCVRTRNQRLAAIHSFMGFASLQTVVDLPIIQRVCAISPKRYQRGPVDALTRAEVAALLRSADRTVWSGQRDWVLFHTLYNTGARVSEVTAMDVGDVILHEDAQVRIHGKGRKDRIVPLWKETRTAIRQWLPRRVARQGLPQDDGPLFPDRAGRRLSRSGIASRLKVLAARASIDCPSLRRHRISPHLIRHSTALHLLQSGVDLAVIAMWLGHESIETTHQYMEADLALKQKALATTSPPETDRQRARCYDTLLRFLESL
jgi:integrase/recombinase XerD